MNKVLRWIIVVGIILVTFVLPVSLYLVSDTKTGDTPTSTGDSITEDTENVYVRFLSIPPKVGIPGGRFMYQVVVDDIKGEGVDILVESKPSWMDWDAESFTLSGDIPAEQSPFFVSIKATTVSGDTDLQSFTVDVENKNASDVKGVQTSRITTNEDWVDPFHPVEEENSLEESVDVDTQEFTSSVLGAKDSKVASSDTDTNSKYYAVAIASFAAFIVITSVYLYVTSDKQKFIKGTGKLIIERGKSE